MKRLKRLSYALFLIVLMNTIGAIALPTTQRKAGASAEEAWAVFWRAFQTAVQKRDRTALRRLIAPTFEAVGSGNWTPNEVIKWLDQEAWCWPSVQKSVSSGTKPYTYKGQRRPMRIAGGVKWGSPFFELGSDGRWRWKGVLLGD